MLRFDHIVLCTSDLSMDATALTHLLGAELREGGRHAHFGTRNFLLGLADGLYLELIAVDTDSAPPNHPRWFGLDRFQGPARLCHWVARSDDFKSDSVAVLGQGAQALSLERGDLSWTMGLPAQTDLAFDGLCPAVIEWQGDTAADRLGHSGVTLSTLRLTHPKAAELQHRLRDFNADPRMQIVTGPSSAIQAVLDTPKGEVVL